MVEHRHINDDPLVHGLVTDVVDPHDAVACPTHAGAATVHHCRVLHYAGANRTNSQPRVYIQSFTAPLETIEGEAERPWLLQHERAVAGRNP